MSRRLFCEISPFTYYLSAQKEIALRKLKNRRMRAAFAREKQQEKLPVCVYKHASLIRRRLGQVDMQLQENKAVNLALAAPKVDRVLIRPGEVFSFWELVGDLTKAAGYREGLVIAHGQPGKGIGGGMCQFTNLIHWMVLHTDLTIIEHHHHDGIDLFPDYGRVIPFGTGTSILYNYLDYRFRNDTEDTWQLITYVDGEYLRGELRCSVRPGRVYHIQCRNEAFVQEADGVYRNNEIWRVAVDARTGEHVSEELLRKNHARLAYELSEEQSGEQSAPAVPDADAAGG